MLPKLKESDKTSAKNRYITRKVLNDLRDGVELDSALIAELHTKSAMDCLRSELNDEDIPWLMELADHSSDLIHIFAVAILKDQNRFSNKNRDRILDMLYRLWDSRPEPPKIRINLMWRLLDYSNLPLAWHEKVYDFITANWSDFIETQIGYMGEGCPDKGIGSWEVVLPNTEELLNDRSILRSKHWAYLCSAMSSNDIPGILRLLDQYGENIGDEFSKNVIIDLRVRCKDLIKEKRALESIFPKDEPWGRHDAQIWSLFHKYHKSDKHRPHLCSPQSEGLNGQRLELIDSIKSRSKAERRFKEIVQNLEKKNPKIDSDESDIKRLADESLEEWRWYVTFAERLAEMSSWNQAKISYEWAERFACLYRIANKPKSYPSIERPWFDGTFIDPLLSKLPLPCCAIGSESLVAKLPQAMVSITLNPIDSTVRERNQAANIFSTLLGSDLRILQWEVMPRDRFAEIVNGQILQVPKVTKFLGKPGGLLSNKNHVDLALTSWRQTVDDSFILDDKIDLKDVITNSIEIISKQVSSYIENISDEFSKELSPDGKHTQEEVLRYQSFIRYITNHSCVHNEEQIPPSGCKEDQSTTHMIVVEDGELTFFCILQYLRKVMTLQFFEKAKKIISGNEDSLEDVGNMLFQFGLLCPIVNDHPTFWVPTSRMFSFARWFLKYHSKLQNIKFDCKLNRDCFITKVASALPVRLDPDIDKQLVLKIFTILYSNTLARCMREVLWLRRYENPKQFLETVLGELVNQSVNNEFKSLKIPILFLSRPNIGRSPFIVWAFSVLGETSEELPNSLNADICLLSASRTCYLPAEDLIRRFQPYPLNLVIIPYDFRFPTESERSAYSKAGIREGLAVPTSIAFATVIGELCLPDEVTKGICCIDNSNIENISPEWLHMYWSAFQSITSSFSARAFEEMYEKLGEYYTLQSESTRQGHEVKRILNSINKNAPSAILKLVQSYFYGVILDENTIKKEPERIPSAFNYHEREGFSDYLIRLAKYAANIRLLSQVSGNSSLKQYINNKKIENSAKGHLLQINAPSLSTLYLKKSRNIDDATTRILYSAMVVSLLLNISKNSEFGTDVIVSLSGESLVFENTPNDTSENKLKLYGFSQENKKFGGTEQSLHSYLIRFPNNAVSDVNVLLEYNKITRVFRTEIPFLKSIIELI